MRIPYEAARTGIQVGLACAALGDRTAAELEFDNARTVFIELGAVPDLERVAALSAAPAVSSSPPGDTSRHGRPVDTASAKCSPNWPRAGPIGRSPRNC